MNRAIAIALFAVACSTAAPALARGTQHMVPVDPALSTPAAQGQIDKGVKLYFGNQKHAKPAIDFGEWATNKKTNAFNKSDREACEWAFHNAIPPC